MPPQDGVPFRKRVRSSLQENEALLLETRKHWIVLLPSAAASVFFLSASAALLAGGYGVEAASSAAAFLLSAACFGYVSYARRFDIWAVTNLRVIDEWGVFSHNAKESPLDKINNVSYRQSLPGRALNYGDVEIQTAAEQGATRYRFVTSPKKLKDSVVLGQARRRELDVDLQATKLARAIASEGTAGRPGIDTKTCPYCAETIQAKAILCRFCGKDLG
ncbi:MAG TPA: PH domain-containing protein [Candidatus Eisenbacteria bacterium]|nr:PH domain-containing protein [Candidatus Eisenbacteria bacterium]